MALFSVACPYFGLHALRLTHRLEEEALVGLLVLPAGAVEEAVAEGAVVDAAVPPAEVGRRAREPLHPVVRPRTL